MDEKNEITPVANLKLTLEGNDLTNQIIEEKDASKLEDLTKLFLLNKKKKDLARINKLSNLIDTIDNEVIARMNEEPESFNNDQLVKYMTATQQIVDNTTQSIEAVPLVQINTQKNEIHIDDSGLNKESRAKVLEVITSILNESKVIDAEVKEK